MIQVSSIQNICIERLWRDVRKDTLEMVRQVFSHLEEEGLLDMEDPVQRLCLFLVFQPRIQASLDRTREAWNCHKVRTAKNKTPVAIWSISRAEAITHGYWTGDPGDPEDLAADPFYGCDSDAPFPQEDEMAEDPTEVSHGDEESTPAISLNADKDLEQVRELLGDFDLDEDDGNWGIDIYLQAVQVFYEKSGKYTDSE